MGVSGMEDNTDTCTLAPYYFLTTTITGKKKQKERMFFHFYVCIYIGTYGSRRNLHRAPQTIPNIVHCFVFPIDCFNQ